MKAPLSKPRSAADLGRASDSSLGRTTPVAGGASSARWCLAVVGLGRPDDSFLDEVSLLGARVARSPSAAEALRSPLPDALLVHAELPDGDGIYLAQELSRRANGCPFALVAPRGDFDTTRRAFRQGAVDVFRDLPAPSELTLRLAPRAGDRNDSSGLVLDLALEAGRTREPICQLQSALMAKGFGPSVRARAGSAVAELLDNVTRHGFPGLAAQARVELRFHSDGFTISVSDQGLGFDAFEQRLNLREALRHAGGFAPLPGLARVEALAESVQLEARPGVGCQIQMTFRDHGAAFEDHDGTIAPFEMDLTEAEYLPHELSRRLLGTKPEDDQPWFELSPALTTCLGRLLGGKP